MGSVNYVLNVSGGKDSLFMGFEFIRRGIPIHSAVYVDMGWEFPWMVQHINQLEKLCTRST
ncbi:hypothetical protein [Maridesulfovibrio sp.]|uniref:hypothetical protein n=1 Tax=Maridesulfovibrio sp. TaxID=2795000 RepID=UPI0029CA8E6D|nr:hypothetical protein [Maridesulfovibrio sp.]